jgi:nucleoside phosphorylase
MSDDAVGRGSTVMEWSRQSRRVDVVILTALRLEYDAVLQVDTGAVRGSTWEHTTGPSGLPVALRAFETPAARPLRVAVAVAADMGATAATNTLLPLVEALGPRCVAMCGVPGRRDLDAAGLRRHQLRAAERKWRV